MSKPTVLAVNAHPDDIELMMAGTLLLLGQAGYELHVLNVANGSCGTLSEDIPAIAGRRTAEARAAAEMEGAIFHKPLVGDLEIYYEPLLVARVAAIVREVQPAIMLVPAPEDYMEDHVNACRLAVSAAFYRGMRNFTSAPPRAPVSGEVTLYHALPWGLRDTLRRRVPAGLFVDIGSVLSIKRNALACHRSQKEWLDASQGLDSYLDAMVAMSREVGRMSGRFEYAEGWRRHSHFGFCGETADPLTKALGDKALVAADYEAALDGR